MQVLVFGVAKDIVGEASIDWTNLNPKPIFVKELKQMLVAQYPDFKKLTSFAVAVNSEYALDDVILKETDEIAIIPPVSGG